MLHSRFPFIALALLWWPCFAPAQTVVNSTYLGHLGACQGRYGDPDCWSPPEVPNNTPGRQYNVIVPGHDFYVDVSATVSNLDLAGFAYLQNVDFTVTGTTLLAVDESYYVVLRTTTSGLSSLFNAGTLSTYSANTLRGRYSLQDDGGPAIMQFNGADITTLADGFLGLYGELAKVTDEFGNDALRNFRRIESSAELDLSGQSRTVSGPFTNEGTIRLSHYEFGLGNTPTVFTATHSLTNFDPADRTLRGGKFVISFGEPQPGPPVELRFNGADIVNNGSDIELRGSGSRITDLLGNDALRNLAHNLPGSALRLWRRDFAPPGAFRNDGLLMLTLSTFTVAGPLANFDAATGTLLSGAYELYEADFKFSGADIVHNGASLTLFPGGKITDVAGNDALRNFRDNLAGGSFTLTRDFTAPGDFTNAGNVAITGPHTNPDYSGKFVVPPGSSYTQTSGTTSVDGELIAGQMNILGGSFSGSGLIRGNLTVTNAVVSPGGAVLEGDLTLGSGSHFFCSIDRYQLVGTFSQITGKAAVAGTLEIALDPKHIISSQAEIVLLQSQGPLTGSFSNAPHGTRFATADGNGSFLVVYEPNRIRLTQFQVSPPAAQLLNISTRGLLSRADNDPYGNQAVLIGGFIVSGAQPKKVAVRGIGPSLANSGVTPVLQNPVLELHGPNGAVILANDDWKDTQPGEIMANQLAPADDRESVIVTTLAPATYTVVLREKNGLGGNGMVEIYDLSSSGASRLANISTRGFTDHSNLLIGGVIVGGEGEANAEVLVRALGPQLRPYGFFANAVEDPTLEVRDANGALRAYNDDWISNYDEIPFAFQSDDWHESALRLSLPKGNYTALVRAKATSGGVAVVEFYDLRL